VWRRSWNRIQRGRPVAHSFMLQTVPVSSFTGQRRGSLSGYSVGSIMTTGVSLDESCANSPLEDGICSQHGQSTPLVVHSPCQIGREALRDWLANCWSPAFEGRPRMTFKLKEYDS
jgi:hypothetical protein